MTTAEQKAIPVIEAALARAQAHGYTKPHDIALYVLGAISADASGVKLVAKTPKKGTEQ